MARSQEEDEEQTPGVLTLSGHSKDLSFTPLLSVIMLPPLQQLKDPENLQLKLFCACSGHLKQPSVQIKTFLKTLLPLNI